MEAPTPAGALQRSRPAGGTYSAAGTQRSRPAGGTYSGTHCNCAFSTMATYRRARGRAAGRAWRRCRHGGWLALSWLPMPRQHAPALRNAAAVVRSTPPVGITRICGNGPHRIEERRPDDGRQGTPSRCPPPPPTPPGSPLARTRLASPACRSAGRAESPRDSPSAPRCIRLPASIRHSARLRIEDGAGAEQHALAERLPHLSDTSSASPARSSWPTLPARRAAAGAAGARRPRPARRRHHPRSGDGAGGAARRGRIHRRADGQSRRHPALPALRQAGDARRVHADGDPRGVGGGGRHRQGVPRRGGRARRSSRRCGGRCRRFG